MLNASQAVLLVVDVQDGFARTMHDERYLQGIVCAIKAVRLIGLPVIITEQAPAKLGKTVAEVQEAAPTAPIIRKESFSCYAQTSFVSTLGSLKRKQIIIAGIEAHGCVWQTAHDLLQHRYQVSMAVDAISAHRFLNKYIGLHRCEREGAMLTTVEMAVTELMQSAAHPQLSLPLQIFMSRLRWIKVRFRWIQAMYN